MSNDQQVSRSEEAAAASHPHSQVREGVLVVPGELKLHFGGRLEGVTLAWRLAGPAGAPVVVALGGISASRRVWLPDEPRGGWWHEVVGPGLALDTQRFRILSFDYLGASADSTGPRDRAPFPTVSAYDQAELLLRLVNHLGISSLRAIAGASYGGMVALAFGERYPDRVARLLVISAADRAHPMASFTMRRCTTRQALAIGWARSAALITIRRATRSGYRSPNASATMPPYDAPVIARRLEIPRWLIRRSSSSAWS